MIDTRVILIICFWSVARTYAVAVVHAQELLVGGQLPYQIQPWLVEKTRFQRDGKYESEFRSRVKKR